MAMTEKKDRLLALIRTYAQEDTVLAFSGGVDSTLLLHLLSEASRETGRQVYAVTFQTVLHPQADIAYASQSAQAMGASHHVLQINELEDSRILENPPDRCYHCKKMLYRRLWAFAEERQAAAVLEGSNQDDLGVYRPGLKAVQELGVASPLAQCRITKADVRKLAGEYGLPAASRPSAPCLATRLPYNTHIDTRLLSRIEQGELYMKGLGLGNVRIRVHGSIARLEVDAQQLALILQHKEEIIRNLKTLGLPYLTLDLEGFRSGSMDIGMNQQ